MATWEARTARERNAWVAAGIGAVLVIALCIAGMVHIVQVRQHERAGWQPVVGNVTSVAADSTRGTATYHGITAAVSGNTQLYIGNKMSLQYRNGKLAQQISESVALTALGYVLMFLATAALILFFLAGICIYRYRPNAQRIRVTLAR